MFSWNGLFIGLTLMVLGVLGVKYAFWLHNVTGPQRWLEKYTGAGTTMGMYKIVSALMVLVGILWATGFGHNVLEFVFSPIAGLFHPGQ